MLTPSIFGRGFFDDFNDFWTVEPAYKQHMPDFKKMSTDVKEVEKGYEIDMELPGFKKEEVTAELKDGYLTISAEHKTENNGEKKEGKYIRRERYYGKYQRSFFVGDQVEQEDVTAKFEDGILKLFVPKKEAKPQVEEKKYITIE
ncbi:MAG: Hsp20/alpha crystallin family protein [Eubacterium sp.]|nr:Hsp20/alpha crystallin family protein [Eubacterium sp.]